MSYALITGASSGIGEAFARRLASDGRDLVLVARSEAKLQDLCDKLSADHRIDCRYFVLDLTGSDAPERLFAETQRAGFDVELLINNAGFGSGGDFAELDRERELAMIRLNISSLVALTHLYLRPMRDRGTGTIVNVSSAAGFQPIPFMATYAATKAFVSSFSEAIAEENAPFGVHVMALCPGSTKTDFFKAANIERPIQVKGQQTAEDVVETAIAAIRSRKRKVVSGWVNKIGALMGTIVPNSISSRAMGKALRGRRQKNKI